MLQLYSYFRSSAAYRVRIALNLKGLKWESIPVNLLEKEHKEKAYLEVNPQGLVPALDVAGVVLNQPLAIIEYLEEVHPKLALLPSDPIAKAQVRAVAYQVAMDIHPVNNLRVLKHLTEGLGLGDQAKIQWLHHWMTIGFQALEETLREYDSNGHFCLGRGLTLADICLIPQVYNAYRFDCPLDDYPLIRSVYKHCMELPEFISAMPENQVDSPLLVG